MLDADDSIATKLVTIREVTELCTSREEEEGAIKEQYEAMLEEGKEYDFK